MTLRPFTLANNAGQARHSKGTVLRRVSANEFRHFVANFVNESFLIPILFKKRGLAQRHFFPKGVRKLWPIFVANNFM
jgi:hypothetical protein